ncbi:DUF4013 domain-containing protein [Haloarchaeobius sp. DFWS5]|uniref:DUF4013 domain-containing protein n=1 Tax=Haloarchaeobius sp. DFWS5 TaxID=3446114 RepID=UPI003EBAC407
MLVDSLKFALRGRESTKTLAIGGGLSLLSFFIPIVPLLFVQGFSVEAMRKGLTGDQSPSNFDDWEELLKEGLYAFGISLVFVGVPMLVFIPSLFVGIFFLSIGDAVAGSAGLGVGAILFLGLMLVGVALTILGYYLVPAALLQYAAHGEFGAAFDVSALTRVAFTGPYFVGMLVGGLTVAILSILILPLYLILVGFALQFALSVGLFNYYGRVGRKADPTLAPKQETTSGYAETRDRPGY